jgi:tRNA pseudouridine65 synthase
MLFRDEHLVAVSKPSGLLVHRGWARDRDVLMTRVRDQVGMRVHPLHRLDRGGSGVVLFALHPEAARRMGALFAGRSIEKTYLALVRGAPDEHGTIDHAIARREDGPRVESITLYRRLAQYGRYALVAARPLTGRPHQIRRHLKHIACPLIGDVRYGKGEHNRVLREQFSLHRLALHAAVVRFVHPFTEEPLTIRAPLPDDLAEPLAALAQSCNAQLDRQTLEQQLADWRIDTPAPSRRCARYPAPPR